MVRIRVQARNGKWFDEVVEHPGSMFEVIFASGEKHVYEYAKLRKVEYIDLEDEVTTVVLESEDTNKEGDKVELYHYLYDNGTYNVRILSTNPKGTDIVKRYNQSLDERRPVGQIFAIKTGPQNFSLLEHILVKSGRMFTLQVIATKDLAKLPRKVLLEKLDKSNFAYANATSAYFFRVDGEVGFGLSMLGISIEMAKKSAKRLADVFRLAEMTLMLRGDEAMNSFDISLPEVKNVSGDPKSLTYDGRTYIRKSYATRHIDTPVAARRLALTQSIITGELNEVSLRVDGPFGKLKGTATVVPNSQIDHDIVTHHTNIKGEMVVSGFPVEGSEDNEEFIFSVIWEHESWHPAVWNRQFEIMLPHAMPASAIEADLARQIVMVRNTIESGVLPRALTRGEAAHDDTGVPVGEQLSDTVNASYMRWPYPQAAQQLVYMFTNGVERRMDGKKTPEGFYEKNWILMWNAVLVSVGTWESATRLGNFKFPDQKRGVAFYDKRIGFVMPAHRFVKTAPYHGGHDQDDQEVALIVKVWCSDPEILEKHLGKTVPGGFHYPTTEAEAKMGMVLLMRSPMGPGEWSLEVCNIDTLPIPAELRNDDIRVIDIAKMPLPCDEMFKDVTMIGMPEAVYSNEEMTRDDALAMIEAQMKNPTVGAVCNPMMIRGAITDEPADVMLANLEDMIDEMNQGSNKEAFEAIAEYANTMLEDLYGSDLDRTLGMTRIRNPFVRANFNLVNGRYNKLQKEYTAAIKTIRTELKLNSLQKRSEQPIVQRVVAMNFSAQFNAWASGFYWTNHLALANLDAFYNAQLVGVDNPIMKMTIQHNRKVAMEEIVQSMVAFFEGFGDNDERRDRHVIALWNYILTPQPLSRNKLTQEYGLFDRIIFQPNELGSKSVMDILIKALSNVGIDEEVKS